MHIRNSWSTQLRRALERKEGGSGGGGEDPEKKLKEAAAELKRITDEVKKAAEEAQKEMKNAGELKAEVKKSIDELLLNQTKAYAEFSARLQEMEQRSVRRGTEKEEERKSCGRVVVESEKLKDFIAQRTRGTVNIEVKAMVFTSDLTDPDIIAPDRLAGIDARPRQRLFIRDLIAPGRTGSNSIQYVQQTGFTNNAAVVSEGVRKPTSVIDFALKTAHVATIAHIIKAAKQLLDDMLALQSFIDSELRYGVKYAEEQQILFGDGTGINLHGIVPQATAFSPAFVADQQTMIDELRLAILQAELAEYPASGIVLHPTNWAQIELTKTSEGAYIFANPLRLAGPSLWGLPIVPTKAMDVGDFLTGAFSLGAQIFDREDANVQVATQNEDDFVKNMITIRGEERLALAVKRPEAFIYGTFTSPTT